MVDIVKRHFFNRGKVEVSYLEWNCSDSSVPEALRSGNNNQNNLLLLHDYR